MRALLPIHLPYGMDAVTETSYPYQILRRIIVTMSVIFFARACVRSPAVVVAIIVGPVLRPGTRPADGHAPISKRAKPNTLR